MGSSAHPFYTQRPVYMDYMNYVDYCIIFFVVSFKNDAHQIGNKRYFIQTVEIKEYNVMIDGQNGFDEPCKMIWKHMKTSGTLLLLSKMIGQVVVYYVIFI